MDEEEINLRRQDSNISNQSGDSNYMSDDDESYPDEDFDDMFFEDLDFKHKQPSTIVTIAENQVIWTDEVQLAEKLDEDIKSFQNQMSSCGFSFDYFKVWKLFEKKNYLKSELDKLTKNPMQVKEFMEKDFSGVNECDPGMVGQPCNENEVCCEICYDDYKVWDTKHLKCNHYFCNGCFRDEIEASIKQGKMWDQQICLMFGCKNLMGMDFFKSLGLDQDKKLTFIYYKKIGQAIARSDVSIMPCKVKDCDKYLSLPYQSMYLNIEKQKKADYRAKELGYSVYREKYPAEDHFCHCQNLLCIGCEDLGHEPCRCEDANKWRNKLDKAKDKLSDLWIIKNTKKCPHCGIPTEKSQGCDHMTCGTCKKNWCWLCLSADWQSYAHKCNPVDLNRKATTKQEIVKEKLELMEKYMDLYGQSDYNYKINVTTAFHSNFEEYLEKNQQAKRFNQNTLERFFIKLKQANKLCIKVRNFITWTYPLGYAMDDQEFLQDYNVKCQLLKQFLENLNYFTERPNISAVLYSIDPVLFKEKRYGLKKLRLKNALYSYEESDIQKEIESFACDNDFLEGMIKKLYQSYTSLEENIDS